jgi:hypothetical protein
MLRRMGTLVLLILLAPLASERVSAAIVFLKGSDQPIAGVIQLQDENHIVIQEQLPDGELRTRDILRSDVDDVIVTVSTERLEGLTPDKPTAYRDYAEELAEKRRDPEAAAVSLRLYLIAAYLDPDSLGRSSLLGMLTLAKTPAEQREFRAMAYLLDPKHDKRILQEPGQSAAMAEALDDESNSMLIAALRATRRGDRRTLATMLKRPSFRAALLNWPGGLSYDEFTELPDELPPETLAHLLQLELSLARQSRSDGPNDKNRPISWSRIVSQEGTDPVPSLRLETLTQYDPRECLFREGQWVKPDPLP